VLTEPLPDWRGYAKLNLDLANPTDEPLVLRLRVFDQPHGRSRHAGYRGAIEIAPHSRAIHSVALTTLASGTGQAQVDTSRIHSVVIARARANRARVFYLARICNHCTYPGCLASCPRGSASATSSCRRCREPSPRPSRRTSEPRKAMWRRPPRWSVTSQETHRTA
jgi:hypothetical protein